MIFQAPYDPTNFKWINENRQILEVMDRTRKSIKGGENLKHDKKLNNIKILKLFFFLMFFQTQTKYK